MLCTKHSLAALAVLLTIPFLACANAAPSGESDTADKPSAPTPAVPEAGARSAVARVVLTKDPVEYSNKELMARGYMPRPDRAKLPAAYDEWLKSTSKPMMLITPVAEASDMQNPNDTSTHWSGIVNNTPSGGYSYVTGRWTVPSLTANPSLDTADSTWVGIDGWRHGGGSNVWQTGTEQKITSYGTPTYYAWYEFYPYQPEQRINNFIVSAGDVITGAVAIVDEEGTMTNAGQRPFYILTNETTGISTGWQEWGSVPPGEIAGGSAEWVVERPTKAGKLTSLANFGMSMFDNMQYNDDSGLFVGIDQSSSFAVNMINPDTNDVLAQTFMLDDSSVWIFFTASN